METSQGVLLKGLPFSSTKADIKQFFQNIEIRDDQITIIVFRNKRPTGLGFVRLKDEEVQMALLNDRNHMGDRYIEVFTASEADLYEIVLRAREEGIDPKEVFRLAGKYSKKSLGAISRDRSPIRKPTKCAYFSGVPKGCTFRHVREFFKGRLIGRNCIHLLREEGGSFRGDGYVEFGSGEECMKGLRKNGDLMVDSVLDVVPCAKEEMSEIVERINGPEAREDLRSTLSSRRGRTEHKRRHTPSPVRKRMKAYAATYGSQEQEMEEYGYGYQEDHHMHRSRRDKYEEQAHWRKRSGEEVPYRDREHMYQHEYRDAPHYQDPPHRTNHHQDPPQRTNHHQDPPQRTGYTSSRGYIHDDGGDIGNGHTPTARSTGERKMVRMDGLPYESTVRHIMDFFAEYRLEHEQIRIQCRDDGSPSGKAFIVFSSEKFARAAVASHDKRYILGRYVEITLV